MSDGGPGPAPLPRPRWVVPIAIAGAVLLLIGIVFAIGWGAEGGDDRPTPQITGTTLPS